jgi:hypothetical protein
LGPVGAVLIGALSAAAMPPEQSPHPRALALLPARVREIVYSGEFAQLSAGAQAAVCILEARYGVHIVAYQCGDIAPKVGLVMLCQLLVPAVLSDVALQALRAAESEHNVALVAYGGVRPGIEL